MATTGAHVRANRRAWDREAAAYERRHARALSGRRELTWGLWRLPESSVGLLGEVRGKRILELGCGAARWSVGLARKRGRPVGLDVSRTRLAQAVAVIRRARRPFPLVQASAESLPFRPRSFDLVFCDWGAMTFCDPDRTVPECARVLESGGLLVFSTSSPLRYLAFDPVRDRQSRRLRRPYFGTHRIEFAGGTEFSRTYGEWIELFQANGFQVERLLENHPSRGRRSSYLSRHDNDWAARWPTEIVWRVRKVGKPAAPRSRPGSGHRP